MARRTTMHMDPDILEKARSMCRRHSDEFIARYLGFPIPRIEQIRAQLPKHVRERAA